MALKYLPVNYVRIASVTPGEDKKLTRKINLFSAATAVVMIAAGRLFVPFSAFLYVYAVTKSDVLRVGALLPALLAYAALYTLLRGMMMRRLGGVKPGYGVCGVSPYVSSGAYFTAREFTAAALIPVAVFTGIYLILNILLPVRWFWFVYILQTVNISGAVWELYAAWFVRGMPSDVLVCDAGTYTEIYAKVELVEK